MSFFSIQTPFQLLEKAEYEWKCFAEHDDQDRFKDYILINLILTLNHLADWYVKKNAGKKERIVKYANDLYPYDDRPSVGRKQSMKSLIDDACKGSKINANQNALVVRMIANDFKHLLNIEKRLHNPKQYGTTQYSINNQFSGDRYYVKIGLNGEETDVDLNISVYNTINAWREFLNNEDAKNC
ncbi:MAG TPA: hypothetical protein PKX12_11140 [Spirochaetota bacterium]|nr:hypothetical protein [Spirochaetota bacterium]